MKTNNKCACVILNYNDSVTTIDLIHRIHDYKNINKIIVVDNNSTDDSYSLLSKYTDQKLVLIKASENKGYGAGNNLGIKYVVDNFDSSYVLISNPDVYFSDDLVLKFINTFSIDSNIAVVSALQKDINGDLIRDIAWKTPTIRDYLFMDTKLFKKRIDMESHYSNSYLYSNNKAEVDCIPGALLMIDTQKFKEIGGYDENMFLYCEETLLSLKIKKMNLKTILITDDSYQHMHSVSINKSIKSKLKQYQMIVNNRFYLLKNYMNANMFQLAVGKIIYSLIIGKRKMKSYLKEF